MNEQERAELERLKRIQSELVQRLSDLGWQLNELESRIARSEKAAPFPPQPQPTPTVPVAKPTPPPPIIPVAKPVVPITPTQSVVPPSIPAVERLLESRKQAAPEPSKQPTVPSVAAKEPALPKLPATTPPTPKIAPDAPALASAAAKGSFEMRLGTYWLVRVGIVMLLTGLVFFGTYAYHNYIGKLGAGGKVALLYVASGLLLGVGAWLQRGEEKLRNYAQVLLAGGLAAVYFTTYAAHYVPHLQIIKSALVDGALLLGWAGFITWVADRKKSELMAFFAILLAYYTSAITQVGLFTLYSNLLLTVAAVYFLVRNRWSALSFASLSATYAGYGFWRFYHDGEWQWASPNEGLWTGVYFLAAYWALFTAAVFLSRHEQFSGTRRAAFLSLNNIAFFTTFVLTMAQVHQGGFWKFALIYGAVLLGLFALSKRVLALDASCANAYLTQGVLLVTVGFVAYYSGLRLGLVLATESFVLVLVGQQMKSRVLQIGSAIVAALAAWWVIDNVQPFEHKGLIAGSAVSALLLLNAFWLRRETTFEKSLSHIRSGIFTALALVTCFVTTWRNTQPEWFGLALAIESVAFLFAARPLGNLALIYGSYAFAAFSAMAQLTKLGDQLSVGALNIVDLSQSQRIDLLPSILIGALMLVAALWEQRRLKSKDADAEFYLTVTFFSLVSLAVWFLATWVFVPREFLAPALALEATLLTAAFYPLRLKETALLGQLYLVFAQVQWLNDATNNHITRPWWNPAAVIVLTLGLAQWWQRQKALVLKTNPVLAFQGIYALGAVALAFFWLEPHFTPSGWLAFTSLLAVIATAYAAITRHWLLAAFGQLFILASTAHFVHQLWDGKPEWYLALAPMAAACLLSLSAVNWLRAKPVANSELKEILLNVALLYRVIAAAMLLWWLHKYVPAREQCWAAATVGLALFLIAGWRSNREALIFSAVFTLAGMSRFVMPWADAETVYLPNLLVLLLLAAQQQMAQRLPSRFAAPRPAHIGAILVAGLGAWLFVSRWILESANGLYLTAGWSALALVLFMVGMGLRERVYRWLGLAVLTCALGRVVIIDVWKLETIYRILSFMALGIVLLVLGFIYNKYQEKIREWL